MFSIKQFKGQALRTDDLGRTLYVSHIWAKKAYVIPENDVDNFSKRMVWSTMGFLIPSVIVGLFSSRYNSFSIFIFGLSIILLFQFMYTRMKTKRYEKIDYIQKPQTAFKHNLLQLSNKLVIFGLVVCTLFIATCVWLLSLEFQWLIVFCGGFFGLLLLAYVYIAYCKWFKN